MSRHEGFKLFVGDLPADITDQEIQMVFQTYGEVLAVHLLPMNSRNNNRCALVFYSSQQSAEDAISVLNGVYRIRADAEQPIKVSWGRDRGGPGGTPAGAPAAAPGGGYGGGPAAGGANDPDGFKLFVGGLPADCTPEELTMVFSTYGEVHKVHVMPPHRENGRVAGFVYYKAQQSAEDAISVLHEKYKIRVDAEQPILVKWAQPKDKGMGKGDQWGGGGGAPEAWSGAAKGGWAGGGGEQKFQTPEGWKLFVGGLPGDITEGELQAVFGTYGQVTKLHLMPPNAQGNVAAFIYYAAESSADDAIKVLHKQYKIRLDAQQPILVSWANDRGSKGDAGKGKGGGKGWQPEWSGGAAGGGSWGGNSWDGQSQGAPGGAWGGSPAPAQSWSGGGGGGGKGGDSESKLFVGNLPDDISDEALRYVFGTYGQVRNVHIMHGKSKSGNACAFVELSTPTEAETAILTLNDKYEIKPGYGKLLVKKAQSSRKGPY